MATQLRDVLPSPYIRNAPTGYDLLGTVLRQPSSQELSQALKIYQDETKGFAGEMTQDQLNRYVDIVRSRRTYGNG